MVLGKARPDHLTDGRKCLFGQGSRLAYEIYLIVILDLTNVAKKIVQREELGCLDL